MTCSETQKLIAEYLGGEMTAAQRTACESHFSQCPDCRQALTSLSVATDKLLAWESVDVPEWNRGATMTRAHIDIDSSQVEPPVVPFPGHSKASHPHQRMGILFDTC